MSEFEAKMLRPRPRWGSLQRSPITPSWILRGLLLRWRGRDERKREGKEGEDKRGERRDRRGGGRVAPKLKLAPPQNYFPGAGAVWKHFQKYTWKPLQRRLVANHDNIKVYTVCYDIQMLYYVRCV